MLAIDTDVITRLLTRDDPEQAALAAALVARETVLVSATVLLETEWVLRSAYGYAAVDRIRALRAFAGLPNVVMDDARSASAALDLMEVITQGVQTVAG